MNKKYGALAGAVLLMLGAGAYASLAGVPSSGDDLSRPLKDDFLAAGNTTAPASGALSDAERSALIEMREEEKLAHDVYATLGSTAGLPIFSNIAASEATHTEAVRSLLAHFGIADPVHDTSVGAFTNPAFASLYTDLVAQGSVSLEEALKVGALIEDLDIADLERHLMDVQDPSIRIVFENLMRGSRNHLRSFTSQLASRGVTYVPSHITQDEYEAIVSSPRERGGPGR